MSVTAERQSVAKPFLKWAGGKSQLLAEIEKRLPPQLESGEIDTYVEAFVGGGAVFFYIAQRYRAIEHFYLLDINEDLVNCYRAIKEAPKALIVELERLENEFIPRDKEERREFFYEIRGKFNSDRDPAKLIFLNKTCYNGLYRVNRQGGFNVPFGDYKNPRICDAENLLSVSTLLERAEIHCADFTECKSYIDEATFVYFDPPYRPLSPTASFTSYSKDSFSEQDQLRLAEFCRQVDAKRGKFLLSNSDPKNEDATDHFFEDHYKGFVIGRVKANRAINCKGAGRGKIHELIVSN